MLTLPCSPASSLPQVVFAKGELKNLDAEGKGAHLVLNAHVLFHRLFSSRAS